MVVIASFSHTARLLRAVCILGLAISIAARVYGASATATPSNTFAPVTTNSAATSQATKTVAKPLWSELSDGQRQALAPLAPEWDKLDSNHKAKWLAIASKYAVMTPDKQQRLQENMREWAKLTPEQHRIARESYARAKKLDAEQKAAQWQQYQQLPDEQKRKLAADAVAKKRIVNLPSQQSKTKIVEPLKSPKKPLVVQQTVAVKPAVAASPGTVPVTVPTIPNTGVSAPPPAANPAPTANK